MLSVLHVSAAAERGGLEVIMLNILKCLDRSRFIPQVLFLTDGPFVREVQDTGIQTHVIDAGRVREVAKGGRAVARMTRLIRDERIDLVHNHNSKAQIYGGLAARIAGIPSLYHLQGVPKPTLSRDGLVSVLSVLIPARRTVACSNYVAQAFKSAWRMRRKVLVVHSGVILRASAFTGEGPTVRKEFGVSEEVPLVVMATRLQRWKGVHVFLDSAAHVVQERPETCFIVVGGTLFGLEKSYAEELRRQADRLGLGQAVVFTGYRRDVSRFYAAADIVVHSSIEPDPFPTVLLEAMASGKPVVASNLGGPREIVEDGVTGLLVPPNSAEYLARAVLTLVRDPGRRVRMGRLGAARVRHLFTADLMVERFQALYEEMTDDIQSTDRPGAQMRAQKQDSTGAPW
jgi:glycosyltransferase involved in cell wall biosynthesis